MGKSSVNGGINGKSQMRMINWVNPNISQSIPVVHSFCSNHRLEQQGQRPAHHPWRSTKGLRGTSAAGKDGGFSWDLSINKMVILYRFMGFNQQNMVIYVDVNVI